MIDEANHDYVIEDLDEKTLVIKENMVGLLKQKLDEVSDGPLVLGPSRKPCLCGACYADGPEASQGDLPSRGGLQRQQRVRQGLSKRLCAASYTCLHMTTPMSRQRTDRILISRRTIGPGYERKH